MSPGCVYTYSCWRLVAIGVSLHQWRLWGVNTAYIHIGVGLALLVSTDRATSYGPQGVKRATVQGFTLEPKYDLYFADIQQYNNGNSMN